MGGRTFGRRRERLVAFYRQLHRMGAAHSVEAWRGEELVGGFFGGHVGAAFFGESMFHRREAGGSDASKVCPNAGAEGLSGLAKAFFYAGARALLVSHWAVESSAAVALTTRALAELAADPGIGRAEALRRSMLSLIADEETEYFAHPAFWAPFVVVGEGG